MRVNKITVYVGVDRGEYSIVTLYRTNTKLAEITNDKIGIPEFKESGVDKNTYQAYCKEVVINLLENGGIEGFYWEPKQTSTETDVIRKYNKSSFRTESTTRVDELINMMLADTDITHDIVKFKDDDVEVKERYKDMNIKYGSTNIIVNLKKGDITHQIVITMELRSGQMCKPKTFTMSDGSARQLNITTINKLYK